MSGGLTAPAGATEILAAIIEVNEAAKTVHGRLSLRDDIKRILKEAGHE